MTWLQKRLNELGYTHADLSDQLAQHGIQRVRATISGWARGHINVTLLADPEDAQVLAKVLKWNLPELLIAAGYPIAPDGYSIPREMLPLLSTLRALDPFERRYLVETILFGSRLVEIIQENRPAQRPPDTDSSSMTP